MAKELSYIEMDALIIKLERALGITPTTTSKEN